MSNITARILQNALLFTLFMSVSLTLHATPKNTQIDVGFTPAEFIVCDSPDQANLDTDIDSHVGVIALREIQPLPLAFYFHYESSLLVTPYSHAHPRAPPVI
ncbi:MAG: hypothetical protein AAF510_06985 [Pseudomonadota bacterium]|jgi:hypothetical protein